MNRASPIPWDKYRESIKDSRSWVRWFRPVIPTIGRGLLWVQGLLRVHSRTLSQYSLSPKWPVKIFLTLWRQRIGHTVGLLPFLLEGHRSWVWLGEADRIFVSDIKEQTRLAMNGSLSLGLTVSLKWGYGFNLGSERDEGFFFQVRKTQTTFPFSLTTEQYIVLLRGALGPGQHTGPGGEPVAFLQSV